MKNLCNILSFSKIIEIIRKNYLFFSFYLLFLIYGLYDIIFNKLETTFLFFNRNNSPILDKFFYYITYIGDGIIYLIVLIPLLIIRIRYAIYGLISYIISGLIAQILKRIFNTPRPKLLLQDVNLYFVNGVDVYSNYSFPSGHAVSAFSLLLLLSIITPRKFLGVFFFLVALFTALSRVYLAQHFFIDVYLGSLIGVIITIIVVIKFDEFTFEKNIEWANKSLIELISKKNKKN